MANFIPPVNGASLGSYFYVEILNSALNTIQIWVGQTTAQGQKNACQGFFMCPPNFLYGGSFFQTTLRNLQNLILKNKTIGTGIELDMHEAIILFISMFKLQLDLWFCFLRSNFAR